MGTNPPPCPPPSRFIHNQCNVTSSPPTVMDVVFLLLKCLRNIQIGQRFSMHAPRTRNISITWKLARNVHCSLHPRPTEPETLGVGAAIRGLISPELYSNLRTWKHSVPGRGHSIMQSTDKLRNHQPRLYQGHRQDTLGKLQREGRKFKEYHIQRNTRRQSKGWLSTANEEDA